MRIRQLVFVLFLGLAALPAAVQEADASSISICPSLHKLLGYAATQQLERNILKGFTDSSTYLRFDSNVLYYPRTGLPQMAEEFIIRTPKGYAYYGVMGGTTTANRAATYAPIRSILENCLTEKDNDWTRKELAEADAAEYRIKNTNGYTTVLRLFPLSAQGLPGQELLCLMIAPEAVARMIE